MLSSVHFGISSPARIAAFHSASRQIYSAITSCTGCLRSQALFSVPKCLQEAIPSSTEGCRERFDLSRQRNRCHHSSRKFSHSPLRSQTSATASGEHEGEGETAQQPWRADNTKSDAPLPRVLNVVLVSPLIPGNTGSTARTCAATCVGLHLVGPLGFQIDDTKLKRAGLDYWPHVVVKVHETWGDFMQYFLQQDGQKRLIAFTKRGTQHHSDIRYQKGDWLVFGSETMGLPPEAIRECTELAYAGGSARIPINMTHVRSLNLAVSVGIGVYEAMRQIDPAGTYGSTADS